MAKKKSSNPRPKVVQLRPGEEEDPDAECVHQEAAERYTKEELGDTPLVCGDCDSDIIIHTMNFVVLTPDKLDDLKVHMQQLAEYQAKVKTRKELGIILPGDDNAPPQAGPQGQA